MFELNYGRTSPGEEREESPTNASEDSHNLVLQVNIEAVGSPFRRLLLA